MNAINDDLSEQPYGDGILVNTPLTFSDGDTVTVLVEPFGEGIRVTDRADAFDRLRMWGVEPCTGKAREAIAAARRAAHLNALGSEPDEIADFGNSAHVGSMVLRVAETAVRIDQLRWLAREREAVTFDDQTVLRIENAARKFDWDFMRRPRISLRGDRTRQVTASVSGPAGTAWVQAVSAVDRERAVEHCYYLFDRSEQPKGSQIAAVAGHKDDWTPALVSDLAAVGRVAFFDDGMSLERQVREVAGGLSLV